jgi:lipopolysaccharide/colanic/teichoic acid biosynthesis glycosyltransferase
VLGTNSTIRGGSVVAQSVVAPGATVQADCVHRHRVVAGGSPTAARLQAEPAKTSTDIKSAHAHRLYSVGPASSGGKDGGRVALYPVIKRVLDFVVALLGLIVLSPLLVMVAILIRLESRGPIFFAHEREGKGGKTFRCLKFRTMCDDAHRRQRQLYDLNNLDGPQFKLENDPRITRVGRWLRVTNIDELPQLINVVLGQMSLIGPRPSPFRENQICVPWRQARLSVRPGITGLWQVCRDDRVEGDFHQWIHYDVAYVRHQSLWLDAKILLATLLTFGARWNTPLSWLIQPRAMQHGG